MLNHKIKVEFLQLSNGRYPVEEFLSELDAKTHKKVLCILELFQKDPIAYIHHSETVQKIKGYEKFKLYELRILFNKTKYRILWSFQGSTCYLIHAFIKKSQKTPLADINTVITRIQAYILTSEHYESRGI